MKVASWLIALCLGVWAVPLSLTQEPTSIPNDQLDPTRSFIAKLEFATHKPLAEQYIWTREDAVPMDFRPVGGRHVPTDDNLGPHFFRRDFQVENVPARATFYVAGPRAATIYLNGHEVLAFQAHPRLGMQVYSCDVSQTLRAGRNVLAIEAMRGVGVGSGADTRLSVEQTRGRIMVAKIVPAELGVDAPPLVITDGEWKSTEKAENGWETPSFDDRSWPAAESFGGIESSIDFFQWNADAGLYDWPGYDGISPFLAQYQLAPTRVTDVYAGVGKLVHVQALTAAARSGAATEFDVQLPTAMVPEDEAPQVLLDFGREVVGRIEVDSDSGGPSDVIIQYGESLAELLHDPYLGANPLHIAPHTTAYGPKSAFRFVLLQFTGGTETRYSFIGLAGIEYPVKYSGYFESSDPVLNQMWTIGAYTAHVCMQDDIWDAPKRDRGRFSGDLHVTGKTIDDVFGDRFLMEDTLERLLPQVPMTRHVNGIPGYSAFWILEEADYYRHMGPKQQLVSVHRRLVELMRLMASELDARDLYSNRAHSWLFVDWSPDLTGDTPESWRATQMEYCLAFEEGVYLLRELGDTTNADFFQQLAQRMKSAAREYLLDASGSYGTRWQTNAFAVLSDTADPSQYGAIWRNSLSSVGGVKYNPLIVTPYYNYYVVTAMAEMGHRAEALDWIRQYWGGMVNEGATSFWESYDPSWNKGNFHASLQADYTSGYYVSLAHGWSSGVTPWLMEQVLGIHALGADLSKVEIRPDLLDLDWAEGGEPTPRGILKVSITKKVGVETMIDLPPGTVARVSIPVPWRGDKITVNGKPLNATPVENGVRAVITLNGAGHYVLHPQ